MLRIIDQLDYPVVLDAPAKRIVSLVPSQTELLHDLGLGSETLGITRYCVHPENWLKEKTVVGGTKDIEVAKIAKLKPDLIIANKEENPVKDVNALKAICPVYISDIITITDALEMIRHVGEMTGKEQQAVDLIDQIQEDVEDFPLFSGKVMYFIWKDPYMVCGQDNFINSVINQLGFENAIQDTRYVQITEEEIVKANPDYIFLSSEPYAFSENDKKYFEELSGAKVVMVDGEMFSWYGSRMTKMKAYFRNLL